MIRVFVTNLGKYNEGELVGEWLALPADEDDIKLALEHIGINEEYEEYFFSDWEFPEGDIKGFPIGEYSNIFNINDIAIELFDVVKNSYDIDIFNVIYSQVGNYEESVNVLIDEEFTMLKGVTCQYDLGHALVHDRNILGEIPERLEDFIDYESVAHSFGADFHIYNDIAISVY